MLTQTDMVRVVKKIGEQARILARTTHKDLERWYLLINKSVLTTSRSRPCSGMQNYKVEIKLVLATTFLGHENELVDGKVIVQTLSLTFDRNNLNLAQVHDDFFFSFLRLVVACRWQLVIWRLKYKHIVE